MSNICDSDKTLKTEYTWNISPKTEELRIWIILKEMKQTHVCGEQDF